MDYSLLKTIDSPADLRRLPRTELQRVADELRAYVLESVSKTGGHLGSNLGTVELTVALHYVFNTPEDRLVWDVGHQTYPHKVLTGRRDRMSGLRQLGGISGFPRRDESPYDTFGTGHASTSFSAGTTTIGSMALMQSMPFSSSHQRSVSTAAGTPPGASTTTCAATRPTRPHCRPNTG